MTELAYLAVGLPALAAVAVLLVPRGSTHVVALVGAAAGSSGAAALAVAALASPGDPEVGRWVIVDAPAGLLVAVIGTVSAVSVTFSPAYLSSVSRSIVRESRRERTYYSVLFLFWAVLVAVPLAGNLGAAWLAVEATTAASALLVGFGGTRRALEAAWKYLVLTSLGLGVALLGVVLVASGVPGGGLNDLTWSALSTYDAGAETGLVAYLLLLAGFAAKVGWAPVHNWLPDAHSEAPAPVSAMLSAALLPAVLLVAWRTQRGLADVVGAGLSRSVLAGFGLVSLAVAVPFLWRALPWKRLLAYSSLEHMGVIALGLAFATPLALAGVVVHVTGHALAKALGFYAAGPLLGLEPRASTRPVLGLARRSPRLGASTGIALGSLAGLPPSPLFASEVLIVAGGFQAGRPWEAGLAALLLALGFLGLAHALLETTLGAAQRRAGESVPGLRRLTVVAAATLIALLALTAVSPWLPGSDLVTSFLPGVG